MLKLVANDGKLIPGVVLSEDSVLAPSEVNEAIVKQLTEALNFAQADQIEALALVVAKTDGCAYIRAAGDQANHALLAGLSDIHYELLRLRRENGEDEANDAPTG